MLGGIFGFVMAKTVADSARNAIVRKIYIEKNDGTVRQKLNGFNVSEYMNATPEEIKKGK